MKSHIYLNGYAVNKSLLSLSLSFSFSLLLSLSLSFLLSLSLSLNDQLPVGLLAQLVERCTGIAEVIGFESRTTLIFQAFFSQLQKLCL